ncbi:hypothetical protein RCL_jg25151.t1 [Rhizophagus clarus]|uniref:Uncharacterized protein n=1 Tax=Rhizophagus clarus TaxID=94130 RepID=A0A8H3LS67_9GLOM|nr:hypothetical protein RCL_jg25151.t1 [Rhizophagus clarus]
MSLKKEVLSISLLNNVKSPFCYNLQNIKLVAAVDIAVTAALVTVIVGIAVNIAVVVAAAVLVAVVVAAAVKVAVVVAAALVVVVIAAAV